MDLTMSRYIINYYSNVYTTTSMSRETIWRGPGFAKPEVENGQHDILSFRMDLTMSR